MTTGNELTAIKEQQRRWASAKHIEVDREGYCTEETENFCVTPSAMCKAEFAAGDGSEFGSKERIGKILALHSSSALAVNFFEYWRGKDLEALSDGLRLASTPSSFEFERKFKTGLGGIAPNLDVTLDIGDGQVYAIECKFTEPYRRSAQKQFLKEKYFPDTCSLWSGIGLPGCQVVAEKLKAKDHDYELLDVAQLLKHMLGLGRFGKERGHSWHLCCLWYSVGESLSKRHRRELEQFAADLGADAQRFTSMTYQELFGRMQPTVTANHGPWVSYMADRYFGTV